VMQLAPRSLRGWERFQRLSLIFGIVSLALCLVGAVFSRQQFFQSYLFAYIFWLGIALGCLGIVMLHNLSGGAWGVVIRRPLESGMNTLPLMALLFLPLLFGLPHLYEWARPDALAHDPLLQHKSAYLNVPFFVIRAALYFALWIGAAWLMRRWSEQHDDTGEQQLIARLRMLSGPGLVIYGLTITFASIDWVMSLEPHWYSTIYGVHFLGGHTLAAFAFAILLSGVLAERAPLSGVVATSHFLDLGNLLLAFVMLWAYFAFSQWLIIWSGNLPEEITWYMSRNSGGWQWVTRLLIVFHFFLPFLLLLSRATKRRAQILAAVAGGIIVMRLVDVFWYTVPAFHPGAFKIHWMDILAPLGLGGIWLAAFLWQLRRVPLIPLHDPYAREVLDRGRV
jgi:hypothetical protein